MPHNVRRTFGLLWALLFASAGSTLSQAQKPPVVDQSSHLLELEDTISIQVFGQQQILGNVPVGPDGNVTAPYVGPVLAVGRTVDQLQADLVRLYRQKLRLRDPIVSVSLIRLRELRATVGGAVIKPGTFPIRRGDTVLSLLDQSGGGITDQADIRRAFLQHRGSPEVTPIDVYALTVLGDTSQNYPVQDGDELIIPAQRNNRIVILGALQSPGQFTFHEPMHLSDAIALAGGEIRFRSRFSKTIILREKLGVPGEYLMINDNFTSFVREGDISQNILLQPGDFIFVPETDSPDLTRLSSLYGLATTFNGLSNGIVFTHIFGG